MADDEELEELLDSALDDFDKTIPSATKHTSGPTFSGDETGASSRPENSATNVEETSSLSAAKHNDASNALEGNVAQEIGNAMKTMLGDSDLLAQLDQIAQATANAEHDNTLLADLEENLSRTMSHLAQNAKDLESCPTGPFNEDFFKAMSEMSLDGAAGDGELDFLPLMQGMMENLLSKDVLYPALKDLQEKYPAWLKEKTASLPPEELSRYSQQYKLVSKICSEYEKESSADSNETKKKRFEKLLGLMQEMQECGQPPLDLIGEMPAAFSGPIPEMPHADEVPEELKNECKVT